MSESPADRLRRLASAIAEEPVQVDGALDRVAEVGELARRLKAEPSLADALIPLMDDPDRQVALAAIAHAPAFDPRATARLRALAGGPPGERRSAALHALARRKDRAILPLALTQLDGDDPAARAEALGWLAWLLRPDELVEAIDRRPSLGGDPAARAARVEATARAVALGFLPEDG